MAQSRKESLAVDLKSAEGRAIVRRLIAKADVFLQNLAPGAAERLGFGATQLRAEDPRLITVSITGFGPGGPMSNRKAYDLLIQAEAGLVAVTGTPEVAVKTGVPTADIAAGMYSAQSVLAALVRRGRTGEGAAVDISMFEATLEWMAPAIYTQMCTGSQPPRMGLSHVSIAPYDAYPTRDGQVLIGIQSEIGWRKLTVEVFADNAMAADSRFADNVTRVQHRAECDAAMAAHTREWTSRDLLARLEAVGIPAAQVNGLDAVVNHPQLQARQRWRTVSTEHAQVQTLLPPVTFAGSVAPMGDVPAHGQHSDALLAEAGLDPATTQDVIDRGIVMQHSQCGSKETE